MTDKAKYNLHPIQLVSIGVRELHITANEHPDVDTTSDSGDFFFSVGTSDYDPDTQSIGVGVRLEIGTDKCKCEEPSPFILTIELVGTFDVDEKFPVKHIDRWARNAAPLILFPYLREHAFALTARCGFKPILLPLLEVPTFKIVKE